MKFKRYRILLILMLCLSLFGSVTTSLGYDTHLTTSSTPELQTSAWVIVMYDDTIDTLYWLDENGEQASLQRPNLPNEANPANPRMLISPNGRILVIKASLANGLQGLGFYDLQTKNFIQTHIAQPGEYVIIGGQHSINANSARIAVGFTTPPNAGSDEFSWRVIEFDLITGNPLDELRSDGSEIQNFVGGEFFTNSIYDPYVVYYHTDEATGNSDIHIQYVVWGEPPFERPTLAWYPQGVPGVGQEIVSSPYTIVGIDFDLATGDALFVHEDPNYPNLGGTGLFRNYNSVARGVPDGVGNYPDPQVLHVDGNSFFYRARWASNGSMVLMSFGNQQEDEQWYYMRMGAGPIQVGSNTVDVIGLPIGFAWVDNTGRVGVHWADNSNQIDNLWQAPSQYPRFLWASIGSIPFVLNNLSSLGTANNANNSGNNNNQGSGNNNGNVNSNGQTGLVHCTGAPPSQVSVGMLARVTFTDGRPLNMRDQPNGTVIQQIDEGTPFNIVSGPLCGGDYTWWEIRLFNRTTGWVAEGDAENYYIEQQIGGSDQGGTPEANG